MRNNRRLLAVLATILCHGSQFAFSAENYTAWQNDYTGMEPHTIALWKFDANPGYNQNTYDGADNPNSYPPVNLNISGIAEVEGKFGTGLLIAGAGETPDVENPVRAFSTAYPEKLFHASALSVEVWYKTPDEVKTKGFLFDKMYISKSGIRLFFDGDYLILDVGNGTTTASLSIAAPLMEVHTWYHFAATYQNAAGNGVLKIFMNGNLLGEVEVLEFGDLDAGDRPWSLGKRSASNWSPLFGTYDNFRISDIAYDYSASP